jgi:hypothetical protein
MLNARRPLVGVRAHPTRSNVRASIEGQESKNSRGKAPRTKGTGKWKITRRPKEPKANDPKKRSADLAPASSKSVHKVVRAAGMQRKDRKTALSPFDVALQFIPLDNTIFFTFPGDVSTSTFKSALEAVTQFELTHVMPSELTGSENC